MSSSSSSSSSMRRSWAASHAPATCGQRTQRTQHAPSALAGPALLACRLVLLWRWRVRGVIAGLARCPAGGSAAAMTRSMRRVGPPAPCPAGTGPATDTQGVSDAPAPAQRAAWPARASRAARRPPRLAPPPEGPPASACAARTARPTPSRTGVHDVAPWSLLHTKGKGSESKALTRRRPPPPRWAPPPRRSPASRPLAAPAAASAPPGSAPSSSLPSPH